MACGRKLEPLENIQTLKTEKPQLSDLNPGPTSSQAIVLTTKCFSRWPDNPKPIIYFSIITSGIMRPIRGHILEFNEINLLLC